MRKLLAFVVLVLGCASVSNRAYSPELGAWVQRNEATVVMADGAWTVLKAAAQQSAELGIELGGCAKLEKQSGLTFIVKDPYASFRNAKPRSITMMCGLNTVLWHTHMQKDLPKEHRCKPSPVDVQNLGARPLGLVVCGLQPMDVVGYGWKQGGVQK